MTDYFWYHWLHLKDNKLIRLSDYHSNLYIFHNDVGVNQYGCIRFPHNINLMNAEHELGKSIALPEGKAMSKGRSLYFEGAWFPEVLIIKKMAGVTETKNDPKNVLYPGNPDWMKHLPESLHKTPLNELAIPGRYFIRVFFLNGGSDLAYL